MIGAYSLGISPTPATAWAKADSNRSMWRSVAPSEKASAVFAAALAVTTPHSHLALLAFVTVLAAAGSDTVASEIGKAWGARTYLFPMMTRVRPGTSGAVSLEGTGAGVVAALALAAIAMALGLITESGLWFVAIAAASVAEGWTAAAR